MTFYPGVQEELFAAVRRWEGIAVLCWVCREGIAVLGEEVRR